MPDRGTEPSVVAARREDEQRDRALSALVVGVEQLDTEHSRCLHGLYQGCVLRIIRVPDRRLPEADVFDGTYRSRASPRTGPSSLPDLRDALAFRATRSEGRERGRKGAPMKRLGFGLLAVMLLVGTTAMKYPVAATHRGATITCRAQQVHVGGPPSTNLDHVTGYLRVDNSTSSWDTTGSDTSACGLPSPTSTGGRTGT